MFPARPIALSIVTLSLSSIAHAQFLAHSRAQTFRVRCANVLYSAASLSLSRHCDLAVIESSHSSRINCYRIAHIARLLVGPESLESPEGVNCKGRQQWPSYSSTQPKNSPRSASEPTINLSDRACYNVKYDSH